MPYAIILNNPMGFDLIVKGLEESAKKGCIASGDLALAIPNCIFQLQEDGVPVEQLEVTPPSSKSPFTVYPGGKS